ncbi:MAG: RluA family pseudouridine synthase [Oscillospiraceae bacterium]|nr:RluA family pseudouridine synthase [Oscillospiraceae bacterium]
MRTIQIKTNDAGQRLDKFLQKLMPAMPKSMLYKLIRKKDIRLNGKRCQGAEILSTGDEVRIFAKEEFFTSSQKTAQSPFLAAQGKPDILFLCDHILVAYKPSGMYAHGGENGAVSLLDEIQKYLYNKGLYLPEQEQTFAPALCNRIDRNTEGLVIAAITAEGLRTMNAAIRDRLVHKHYLAVTAAHLPEQKATCTAWLRRDERTRRVTVTDEPADGSKRIVTQYKVLAQNGNLQLAEINLLTGRTHQIRAHLAHLGAPLLGDPKYGGNDMREENQCLCAHSLTFTGLSGTILDTMNGLTVRAPLPDFVRRYFPEYQES